MGISMPMRYFFASGFLGEGVLMLGDAEKGPSRLQSMRQRLGVMGGIGAVAHPFIAFVSHSDGIARAQVHMLKDDQQDGLWQQLERYVGGLDQPPLWLRIDVVNKVEACQWGDYRAALANMRRGYARMGLALDANFDIAFLEMELNANAMLDGGRQDAKSHPNIGNIQRYAAKRFPDAVILPQGQDDFADDQTLWVFTTRAIFSDARDGGLHLISGKGLDTGRRDLPKLTPESISALVERGSRFLADQVQGDGKFHYGWHACFDRDIPTYNVLRHTSTIYAMLEAWELSPDPVLADAIERALGYLTDVIIHPATLPSGEEAAFLVDAPDEIKLGANAVAILALIKYGQLLGGRDYSPLMARLARGILHMQQSDGSFVHVLRHPSLELKDKFRIIYYDGEAVFALIRLYGVTKDEALLDPIKRAFAHFIKAEHWQANDHWLSYSANEWTQFFPDAAIYEFGLRNVKDYLNFALNRTTTFPTLLELLMAAEKMIRRLSADPHHVSLLQMLDMPKFYRALHHRAHLLIDGHFWPELAMFFGAPSKVEGSFFVRHHGFRVRIDDVEHYLSGLIAYRAFLLQHR